MERRKDCQRRVWGQRRVSACGERRPAFGEAQVRVAGAEDDLRGQAGSPAVV